MKKRIFATLLLCVSVCTLLTGCSKKDDELSKYKNQVDSFYKTVTQCDTKINKIDTNSASASKELLEQLDILDQAFADFADAEVPYQFASVESLADEASNYMSESVSLYHEAFESDPFDEISAGIAQQKYKRAIVRINYIGQLLQGKELSGDGITSYTEDGEDDVIEDEIILEE